MITLPPIIGMPPSTHVSEALRLNSMPVLEIAPHTPNWQAGLSLFRLKKAWEGEEGYHAILKKYGYELDSTPLKIAFLADSFPSDSFTNEYSESFLNKITDVASSAAAELTQMMGGKTLGQGVENFANALKDVGGLAGAAGSAIGGTKDVLTKLGSMTEQLPVFGRFTGSGIDLLSKTMGGQRVDFPQLWRNSGFGPSYSITCRLYNPSPGSREYTEKYIIGPIAALLCLSLPQTTDGHSYSWPFLHKIKCRGMFNLPAAFIGNMTIIKGGDQQQIAWNQRLGIVDVRIDFGGLYSSMLVGADDNDPDKSSLYSYLENLRDETTLDNMYADPTTETPPVFKVGGKEGTTTPPTAAGLAMAQKIVEERSTKPNSVTTITTDNYKEQISMKSVEKSESYSRLEAARKQNFSDQKLNKKYTQNSSNAGGTTNVTDSEAFDLQTSSRVSSRNSSIANNLNNVQPSF